MKVIAGIQIAFLSILAYFEIIPWIAAIILTCVIMYMYDERNI